MKIVRSLICYKERLPDGLDNLADYNLVTLKSFREALDDWALKELTEHYVNYRKHLIDDPTFERPPQGETASGTCRRSQ